MGPRQGCTLSVWPCAWSGTQGRGQPGPRGRLAPTRPDPARLCIGPGSSCLCLALWGAPSWPAPLMGPQKPLEEEGRGCWARAPTGPGHKLGRGAGLRSGPLTSLLGLSPSLAPSCQPFLGMGLCLFLGELRSLTACPGPCGATLQGLGGAGGGALQGAWGCSEARPPTQQRGSGLRGHQWIKGLACVHPLSHRPALSWERGRGSRSRVVI